MYAYSSASRLELCSEKNSIGGATVTSRMKSLHLFGGRPFATLSPDIFKPKIAICCQRISGATTTSNDAAIALYGGVLPMAVYDDDAKGAFWATQLSSSHPSLFQGLADAGFGGSTGVKLSCNE